LLLVFSGANLDISTLPRWMQAVSNVLPLTRGVTSTRVLIAGGKLAEITPLLGQEILIGISYVLSV